MPNELSDYAKRPELSIRLLKVYLLLDKADTKTTLSIFSSKEINLNFVLAHISAYKSKYSKALGTDH